jgi:uncharacterized pyridoxal phosphate-containing UPF0001 family protein
MVEPFSGLDSGRIRERLEEVRARIAAAAGRAGREPAEVELLVAAKYVRDEEFDVLLEAGVELVGENRAQALAERQERFGGQVEFDFIGNLQSRKVRELIGRARIIHSVASDSALRQLERHGNESTRVMIEVNVSGEDTKGGVAPDDLPAFLDSRPVTVVGLMTLPPPAPTPQESRPYFAALRELAERHGLAQLSMGTSQDYEVAVEEGATIVRVGTILFA